MAVIDYNDLPFRMLKGCKVVLLEDMINVGGERFRADTIMVICGKHRGFRLALPDAPSRPVLEHVEAGRFQFLGDYKTVQS